MADTRKEMLLDVYEEHISIAESCGLVFTGDFDDEGLPIFMGTIQNWESFDRVKAGEDMAKNLNKK